MGACYAGAEHRQSKARSVAGSRRAMRSAEQRRQSLAASRATQCACAGRGGVAGCVWRAVRPATCGERRAARADCRSRIAWAQRTGCGRRGAEKTRSRARKATARCACRRRRVKRPGARVITSHGESVTRHAPVQNAHQKRLLLPAPVAVYLRLRCGRCSRRARRQRCGLRGPRVSCPCCAAVRRASAASPLRRAPRARPLAAPARPSPAAGACHSALHHPSARH